MKTQIKLDPMNKILAKRKLQKGGEAQIFLTNEIARLSDDYIPFRSEDLKNVKIINSDNIHYTVPYAKKQYNTNAGASGGRRGKLWDKRMWSDKGKGVLKSVGNFVGGRPE